jgi:hypothetical protein
LVGCRRRGPAAAAPAADGLGQRGWPTPPALLPAQLGEVRDYRGFWGSQQWQEVVRMANWMTYQNYATVGLLIHH